LSVSELGFGALEIGRNWPYWRRQLPDFSRPSEAEALRVIGAAIDEGINFFDTAPAYFKSEEILGKALKGKRENVILATKCGEWFDGENSVYDYSAGETIKFVENSLRLLKTDHIDLLQIHSASADVVRKGETLSAMKKAQEQGKVRFVGISTDQEEAAMLAIESDEYDTIQVSYNIVEQDMHRQILPLAFRKSVGVIIKAGMKAGQLSSKFSDIDNKDERANAEPVTELAKKAMLTTPELALRFVLSSRYVSTVIIGTKSTVHLKSNAEAAIRGSLDQGLLSELFQLGDNR
jgi:aryl-alcohol dehydrogenase-like predicted oxidoreductase